MLIDHSVTISGDPDQMPFSVVSDLALHCLPMPHKKEARLIWVNKLQNSFHSSAYFSYIRVHSILILNSRLEIFRFPPHTL